MSVIAHCLMDEQAFKEAVWSIDRSSFRPGDALDAFERAKVKCVEPSTTQGAADLLAEFVGRRADSSLAWLDDWTRRVDAFVSTTTGEQ